MRPNAQNEPFCPLKTCVNINGVRGGGSNIIGLDWNFVWDFGVYRRSTGEMSSMIWKKGWKMTHPSAYTRPLRRLNLSTKIHIRFQTWVVKENVPTTTLVCTGDSCNKSEAQRRSNSMILYNSQLTKSHRRLIWIYQTLSVRKCIYVWQRVKLIYWIDIS